MSYQNPVLPGFYPDPSICRVEDNYYLVTSSFEYFPGVPLFHSHDLIHWQQIGHCLTRASQLPLKGARASAGIFAPTLRHHEGRFYMLTSNVSVGQHFYVFSDDPKGEWSEPIWIQATGIDPSFFFDDDGKVYLTWTDAGKIWQAELDIKTGKLLSTPQNIWSGTGGRYPEAPHLYKIGAWYYLLLAEGGTEYGHMITLARSASPWGDFEPCPHNPILTHRNTEEHPIQGTGHGDLIQAHDGSWWMVFLAFRHQAHHHHLGRETFLAPVQWDEQNWLHVNHDQLIELDMQGPTLPQHPWEAENTRDDFDQSTLGLKWNFLRNPAPDSWSLSERPSHLRLKGSALTLDDDDSPAFVGCRQRHFECQVISSVDVSAQGPAEEAGLTVLMNPQHHYEIALTKREGQRRVFVRRRIGDLQAIVAEEIIPEGRILLRVDADTERYTFSYQIENAPIQRLATAATRYLSSETAGGFTGVYFGLYAVQTQADFDWFDYVLTKK